MRDLTQYSYCKNLSNVLNAIDQTLADARYIEAAHDIDTTKHRMRLIIAQSAIEDIHKEAGAMI